ncbi:U3 small nucleolar RNA-associated protein [Drechslerella dactyloides]|uniref:U3 small nucleolar RNA-associated protein n=1 Tax=Drechslerella dactyloides TaxID=74499 RepID=A0AAD6J667_DREDA|nr:U3 small nucleolar RNA-associated protein [Drechslerella dactyloides]
MGPDVADPPAKRARLDVAKSGPVPSPSSKSQSRIFAPFRSLGHVTTSTPFALLQHSATFQLSTSTGHSVSTYDIRRLNLLFVTSPRTPSEITSIHARGKELYVGFRTGIWIFERGKKTGEMQMDDVAAGRTGIKDIFGFGDWLVGIIGPKSVGVWKIGSRELYTTIELFGDADIVNIVHPPTFLNKICIGTSDGGVEIWNIRSGKLVYSILPPKTPNNVEIGYLTSLSLSTHHSVIAMGFSSGIINIHNVQTDTSLFQLSSSTPVTSLSFRSDLVPPPLKSSNEPPSLSDMLASASSNGNITLWSLKTRKAVGIMRGVHSATTGGVTQATFLPGQNVLVTSGGDNAIKLQRGGHAMAPSTILFHPNTHFILSASLDHSLWGFSLRSDAQSTELSQGNVESTMNKLKKAGMTDRISDVSLLKGAVITCIAVEGNRDGAGAEWGSNELGWEGVITGGREEAFARSWSWSKRRIGRWTLPTGDGGEVKSVAISPCGTFGLVGSAKGAIDMYNLQSGIHRARFPARATKAQIAARKNGQGSRAGWKHAGAVTGLAVDSVNRVMISCGLDGFVKFWEFQTGLLQQQISFTERTACTALRIHRSSGLLAISCDDLGIRIVDMETRKVVRELWGCGGRISDLCFSNDSRWLIAASMDSAIRVWDLPTGHLIDGFKTQSVVNSISFSPDGNFLATASIDSVGVGIYTNKTVFTHVPTRRISEDDIYRLTGPTSTGEGGTGLVEAAFADEVEEADAEGQYTTVDQLSDQMLTMSLLPKNRWVNLLHLEAIKSRNRPKDPIKKPEKAPFFLGSLASSKDGVAKIAGFDDAKDKAAADDSLDLSVADAARRAIEKAELSRVKSGGSVEFERTFTKLLIAGSESGDYTPFIEHLKSLPPSTTDLEIRTLDTTTAPYFELIAFVEALTQRLRSRKDYELVLTWMRVFLKIHGGTIANEDEEMAVLRKAQQPMVKDALQEYREEMKQEAGRVIIITGAASGIGLATANQFLSLRAKVAALDIQPPPAETAHDNRIDILCDVTSEEAVAAAVKQVLDTWSTVDVLINAAGVVDNFTRVAETTSEIWHRCLNINLTGPFNVMRAVIPHFLTKCTPREPFTPSATAPFPPAPPIVGRIVNICSAAAVKGCAAGAAYTASKHALLGLSRNTSFMYTRDGILTNVVIPGGVATNIMQNSKAVPDEIGYPIVRDGSQNMPGVCDVEEVARTVVFLAGSKDVNGAEVSVDRGWTVA